MSQLAIVTGSTSDFECGKYSSVAIQELCNKTNIPFFNYNFDEFKDLRIKPSWHKLYAVIDTFTKFDNVLWIDADIVPVKAFLNSETDLHEFSLDLQNFINSDYYQALVCYCLSSNLAPNMGLFMTKKIMIKYYIRYLYEFVIDGFRNSDNTGWYEQIYAAKYMGFFNYALPLQRRRTRALQNRHLIKQSNDNKFNGWRLKTATELFNNTLWLPQHYNCFDFEKALNQNLTYENLTIEEQKIYPQGTIPKNGGAKHGEKEWFYHAFYPLKEQRLIRLKSKL